MTQTLAQSSVQSVKTSFIKIGDRMRPMDSETVLILAMDIQKNGLLAPIALRALPNGMHDLIYGHNRLLAYKHLAKTSEAFNEIPATVWPSDTPDWKIELAEIAENLCWKELTADERTEHTLRAAAIYKRQGLVASVEERNAENGKASGRARSKKNDGTPCATVQLKPTKPTVAEKLSTDLGINKKTAQRRVRTAAKKVGKSDVSLERSAPDELQKLADDISAHRKEQASKPKLALEKPKAKKHYPTLDDVIADFKRADEVILNRFKMAAGNNDIEKMQLIIAVFNNAKSARSKVFDEWEHVLLPLVARLPSDFHLELEQTRDKRRIDRATKNKADRIEEMAAFRAKQSEVA